MGSDMVEEAVVVCERGTGGGDGEFARIPTPELDACGVVVALDDAVELGPARRQDLLGDVVALAGLLELGPELAAAVDLDGTDREGHVADDVREAVM